jgi:hypothetical protein
VMCVKTARGMKGILGKSTAAVDECGVQVVGGGGGFIVRWLTDPGISLRNERAVHHKLYSNSS